ncbi:MAG: hypothetical protein HRU18_00870 [Pseudoalteromonas sp.]|uniref:hypothetical protein n=1 Tax=Pseudoalteromonas sp. TaxID=53249 RepID=UPI001D89BD3B|nr:hypothetical protein [Pseudoalteromonas sp.]NRA76732.1 hypothetical protein [Pseudoalteromonas sp.]
MRILVACEESQAVTIELRSLGHEAFSCDVDDCSGGHPEWHIKGDVLNELNSGWDMMIAHPPCTRLTNAGRRWMHIPPKGKTMVQMWSEFFEGVEFYKAIRSANIPKIAIENPVMHDHARELLGKHNRNIVQPWWFGEKMFKATGFELKGLEPLIATNKLTPPKPGTDEHKKWSFIHRMSPGPERTRLRSKTPIGIAKAMAEQWAGNIKQLHL